MIFAEYTFLDIPSGFPRRNETGIRQILIHVESDERQDETIVQILPRSYFTNELLTMIISETNFIGH